MIENWFISNHSDLSRKPETDGGLFVGDFYGLSWEQRRAGFKSPGEWVRMRGLNLDSATYLFVTLTSFLSLSVLRFPHLEMVMLNSS